jgi:hypothetical protein
MTGPLVDAVEIEALVTDRYLDSLLAGRPDAGESISPGRDTDGVAAAVRSISHRLAMDLPRFHPSFRFEERLALRLAELAASMRLPVAAGGESQPIPIRTLQPLQDPERLALDPADDRRPLLIGGAVAASAISLAGAWLAWRDRRRRAT